MADYVLRFGSNRFVLADVHDDAFAAALPTKLRNGKPQYINVVGLNDPISFNPAAFPALDITKLPDEDEG